MIHPVAVAIDLGTSSVKAGLVTESGESIGVGRVEYELDTPTPDWVECSPDVYWEAACSAVREAMANAERAQGRRPSVSGVSFSCQGETLLCLDDRQQPLRPAIVWLDNRSGAEAVELLDDFGLDQIYPKTGLVECIATWPATKTLWLARHEPAIFKASRSFALLEDWFMLRMSGTLAAETSLHSTSLWLDIQRREWWLPMLDRIGLAAERLPKLVEPGTRVGVLRTDAAAELGLPPGIPVVAGCLDAMAAALGSGNVAPGQVTEQTGTILAVASCLRELPSRSYQLPIYLHAVPEMYCANPYAQTAALVLKWVRDNLFGAPGSDGRDFPYEAVIAEAATVPPGSEGLLLLPHLCGAYFPEFDLSAQGALVGLTLGHRRAHIVRAALEAVAFMLRSALDGLRGANIAFDVVTSLGKPAESRLWSEIKADVCQLPVRRLRDPEVALLGAAMLVFVERGLFTTVEEAASAMSRQLDVIEPDPAKAPAYDEMFGRYREVYSRLAPYFHREEPRPAGAML